MQADQWRQRWGLHTPETLRVRAQELGASPYVIKGLLPARQIAILLGDSGLGKSPLMYQAAVCVASGLPFLGCETLKGRVVIADFENGLGDMSELVERISRYLGLPAAPADLHIWSLNDCESRFGQVGHTLLDMLRDVHPTLAIVDSLGSYDPDAEEKNSAATRMLKNFRSLARDCETASWFVHHRRKQSRKSEESAGPLESANIRRWFQDARGASSLINGSDIRLGVDAPDLSAVSKDEISLVLRGFGRVRGEIGPLFLARDVDENGEPIGYRRLMGSDLLFNEDQKHALMALSDQFSFKQVKSQYGRADQGTANFLQRCVDLNLIRKLGRGRYEKVPLQNSESDGARGETA
jgi:AAA domain